MVVIPSIDIARAAAALRFLRVLAAGLLALGLFASQAAARADGNERAWTSSAPAHVLEPPQGLPLGSATCPGLDMDEPSEDGFKLGRAIKAPSPSRPDAAHLRPSDLRRHGMAAALPERPPRA